ncbi:ATP-dependent nuclease [Dolosigranulum pigrum]|uniref:ATP-dependent nuclease n=1 Tax=Dolosigranulum pigrum TaxID=29394 RepID=UPI001AD85C4C|nr:AAA family ATPase [Dolosigranulum pigrum]QTJ32742.1 DUF2813 domain-containing protein [Dolosigranulum pigrum]
MKICKFGLSKFRSIDKLMLIIPQDKPLILFGPNNAGKSNILSAINRMFGERYPTYIDVEDSDYFMRNQEKYPKITLSARFNKPFVYNNKGLNTKTLCVVYGFNGKKEENVFCDGKNELYVASEHRKQIQSFLLDTERNANYHFNYSNKYSLLSKINKSLHNSLTSNDREKLSESFKEIKQVFEEKSEFTDMFDVFQNSIENSVKGFIHHLKADFSAYDPNNFAKSLRINAHENNDIRSFEEFGTGEQQILIMALAKAYMQMFKNENFIFILEEPEANLHPLAQKWLKKYIYDLCKSGIQVIMSTHSPNFINPSNLEGLVRVYKKDGITKVKQLDNNSLKELLVDTGVPKDKIGKNNLGEFFELKLDQEQLEGLFAKTVVLVEGSTEKIVLPIWLEREDFSLPAEGVEIINCMGKNNIPTLYRIYKAYGYRVICVFDGDVINHNRNKDNNLFKKILGDFESDIFESHQAYVTGDNYLCFSVDYETTVRSLIGDSHYNKLSKNNHIGSKPGVAKYIALNSEKVPSFIPSLINIIQANSTDEII